MMVKRHHHLLSGQKTLPVSTEHIMEITEAGSGAVLTKVSLTHKGHSAGELVIKEGNKLYINNTSSEQLNLAAGTMIAGSGAGTWRLKEMDRCRRDTLR